MKRTLIITAAILSAICSHAQMGYPDPEVTRSVEREFGGPLNYRASRTPDGAWDHIAARDREPQPVKWQHLRESDILWKKRVWSEINTLEKQNLAFRYAGDEHTGGGMFIEILVDAINKGKIVAYTNDDDRFSSVLSKDALHKMLFKEPDTQYVIDIDGTEILTVVEKDFVPGNITKYRLKEDWMFDRNTGQMVVRIVGIAPVIDVYDENHQYRGSQAMFWLYYPDLRGLLARYEVINSQNDLTRATWDDFFEGRMFSAHITKESNPYGPNWAAEGESFAEHGLSQAESLYEGKRVANEIFNKEHDMWSH